VNGGKLTKIEVLDSEAVEAAALYKTILSITKVKIKQPDQTDSTD